MLFCGEINFLKVYSMFNVFNLVDKRDNLSVK